MKITCEGCGAKYSIADAKVAGRAFKIRCKRCGAGVAVRGGPVAAAAAEGDWHVVVGEAQEGPFTAEQLTSMLELGTIGLDAFVWQEGMAEWAPLASVPELSRAVSAPRDEEADPSTEHRSAVGHDPEARRMRRRVGNDRAECGVLPTDPSGACSDLFASAPVESAEPVDPSASALTGERNESSVLFSLSNLRGISTAPPRGSAPEGKGASAAAPSDGSGLIDIRALAALSESPAGAASSGAVEELLALGGGGIARSALGAPVLVPARREGGRSAVIVAVSVASVVAAAAAALVVVVVAGQSHGRAMVGAVDAVAVEAPVIEAPGMEAPGMEAQRSEQAAGVDAPPARAEASPSVRVEPAGELEPEPPEPAPSGTATGRELARADRRARPERDSSTRPAPPGPTRPASPATERTFERLIDDAVSNRPPTRPVQATEALPSTPSRSDVVGAMSAVSGAVRACGGGASATLPVRIVFSGATGQVQSAEAQGAGVAPEVRSCVARAAREARVPRFGQSSFSVTYPFRL